MNLFTSTMLATSLLLIPIACSKESQKQPETPSNLQPASGTEPAPDTTPPGLEDEQQQQPSEEMQPGTPDPTQPGYQDPSTDPSTQDPNVPPSGQEPGTTPESGGGMRRGSRAP